MQHFETKMMNFLYSEAIAINIQIKINSLIITGNNTIQLTT